MLLAALVASTLGMQAQEWHDTGNPAIIPGFNFLGSTNNAALDVRTSNILRMRLNESLPGQPVNNFPNVDLSGHLGIGAPVPPQALSFLHVNNNGSFFAGFRPWMRPQLARVFLK